MSSKFFIFFQLSDGSQRQNPGAASCQELWARMKSYEIGAAGRKACFWRDARILVPLASIQWTEWTDEQDVGADLWSRAPSPATQPQVGFRQQGCPSDTAAQISALEALDR